ncbi:MAG: hypothetical protein V3W32_08380 [Gemmatimonadota bacterium]
MKPVRAFRMLAAAAMLAAAVTPLAAQQLDPIPTFAPGGNAVLLPVQSVKPLPTGAWPGGVRSHGQARKTVTAELTFAFQEAEEGSSTWALPPEIIDVMDRNPILHVDPEHLAYQSLLDKPKNLRRYQVYEPLHGQLRAIAAMFDTRHVALPLAVWYEPYVPPDLMGEDGGAESDREAESAGGREDPAAAEGDSAASEETLGRAVLLLTLIDIRRSEVLWHGEVRGDPAPIDSSALFATLAERVAAWLVLY